LTSRMEDAKADSQGRVPEFLKDSIRKHEGSPMINETGIVGRKSGESRAKVGRKSCGNPKQSGENRVKIRRKSGEWIWPQDPDCQCRCLTGCPIPIRMATHPICQICRRMQNLIFSSDHQVYLKLLFVVPY